MNKKNIFLWLALGLVFIVIFNIIVFLVNRIFTPTFWVSYVFIHIAYVLLILSLVQMPKVKNSQVLGYPLIYLSYLYFISSLVIGIIFMFFNKANVKLVLILQLLILGLYSISFISNLIANEKTTASEKLMSDYIFFIKSMTYKLEQLLFQVSDDTLKKNLESVYDSIKSSQVKSHPSLINIENDINREIDILTEKINKNIFSDANIAINNIRLLLSERNNKIKLLR